MENIINHLKNLKKLGATAIKQSLEDEGAGFNDVALMRKISKKIGLKLNVKIGGCEAKNDIHFCNLIKVDAIVAPMVESEYALRKFIQTVPRSFNGSLYINLETKNAFLSLRKILNSKEFNKLNGVVIGRSDLAGSYNLEKPMVDSKKIYKILNTNLKKIKSKKKSVKMGGSITKKSKEFIKNLFKKKLIDRIETRNIELKLSNKIIENLEYTIPLIFSFEIDWLKYKNQNFKLDKITKRSNLKRIYEIDNRLKKKEKYK